MKLNLPILLSSIISSQIAFAQEVPSLSEKPGIVCKIPIQKTVSFRDEESNIKYRAKISTQQDQGHMTIDPGNIPDTYRVSASFKINSEDSFTFYSPSIERRLEGNNIRFISCVKESLTVSKKDCSNLDYKNPTPQSLIEQATCKYFKS